MTRLFLDANVIVAVLNKEYPVYTHASRILSLASQRKYEVYTSPLCLAIAFYFAEKKSGSAIAKKKIDVLCDHIKITQQNDDTVIRTLENKKINDFEDGLEYYSAKASKCNYIITSDIQDFYFSDISVFNCKDFFEEVLFEKQIS